MYFPKIKIKNFADRLALFRHIFLPERMVRIAAIAIFATFFLAGTVNAYLLEHGFESGDLGPFDFTSVESGDSIAYTTSLAHTGSYSAKSQLDNVAGAQATHWKSIAPQTRIYMRVYYYLDPAFFTSDNVTLMCFLSGWSNRMSVSINDDDTLYLWNSVAGQAYGWSTGLTMSRGTWHSIEMMVDISAGEARVWLDGNLDIEATGIDIGADPVDRVSPGAIYWSSPKTEANIIYIDDVIVDTQYIGGGGAISVNPASMGLYVGDDGTASISGGTTPYSAGSSSPSVATADINGTTLTITGVSEGTATITVTDDVGASDDVIVTVTQPLIVTPTSFSLFPSQVATVTVSGGSPGYTVVSGNESVATATISGSEVTITAVGGGTITVTVTDAVNNHAYITVNVGDSITPGLGDCPVPPFAQAGLSPNVMIMFDTSGSMEEFDGDGVSRFDEAKQALLDFLADNKNINFGLARLDGSPWNDAGNRAGGLVSHHAAIKGGRILVPNGYTGSFATSADYIIDYINTHFTGTVEDWRNSGGARHWTNLAETMATIGRYFATMEDGSGNRTGKGPDGFGYYRQGIEYDYYYNSQWWEAATHDDHGKYIDTTSPLLAGCEQAFVIMFTDGLATMDNDWDLVSDYIGDYDGDGESRDCKRADPLVIRPGISDPNDAAYGNPLPGASYPCDTRSSPDNDRESGEATYLDDVTKFLYENDMRSDIPGTQNIITYTIGFYVDDQLLRDAADNGGGQYFTASSIDDLTNALQTAMQDIMAKVASGTAVSTITTSSQSDDYLFRAKFFPGASWKGYVEKFKMANVGTQNHEWEAGAKLNARVSSNGFADRKIYTYMSLQNPRKQLFTSADGAVKTRLATLWSESPGETADIVDYIRGDDSEDGGKYRDRHGWLLGDIIYSTPTPVGAPKAWYFDNPYKENGVDEPAEYEHYQAFKAANSGRKTMLYVGANDGMLHAFDAESGEEDWAFIPYNIHTKLEDLTTENCHKYFVDLSPYIADAWDESDGGGKWKSVLIGGNRLGGEEYFALDITDPAHDQFSALWDVIPFSGRKSSTVPTVGKVKADGGAVDHWVAVVTSGYTNTTRGEIAALKISNGSKAEMWIDGSGYENDVFTGEKGDHINPSPTYYTMTSPAAIDSDLDGYLDLIYAGDTEGTLWKFYYDYEADGWKKFEMFHAPNRSITATPALAFDPDGKLRIYFGTGRYIEESDKANQTRNAFYCLVDEKETSGSAGANKGHYTRRVDLTGQLVDITDWETRAEFNDDSKLIPTARDTVGNKGWYFLLDDPIATGSPAERILGKALVVSGVVFVTSFAPNQDVCGGGGDSRLYAFDYMTAVVDPDLVEIISYQTGKRYTEIGYGVPSEVVYYFDPATKTSSVIIQKSDSEVVKQNPALKERPMLIQSWRAR